MQEFFQIHHDWFRALHIIAVISWMAGLLYLPRLFVYHADTTAGSDRSETFKIMEHRLLRYIMHPAMIATWVFGVIMLYGGWDLYMTQGWMHVKLLMVVLLTGSHHVMQKHVKRFAQDANTKTTKYFRIFNEVPTILMIIIVIMAVVQPF